MRTIRFLVLATIALSLGAGGCAKTRPCVTPEPAVAAAPRSCSCHPAPTALSPSSLNTYSREEDVSLGQVVVANWKTAAPDREFVDDTPLNTYFYGLLDELLAHAPEYSRQFTYRIQVYRDPVGKNAYAAPGGWLFISLEILAESPSEGAIAGIVGHEIGHAALRHSTAQLTFEAMAMKKQSIFAKALASVQGVFSPRERELLALFEERRQHPGHSTAEENRRSHELEADVFSTQLLAQSRFSADEFRMWHLKRTCLDMPGELHHGTHPLYIIRAATILREMAAFPDTRPRGCQRQFTFAAMRTRAGLIAARKLAPEKFEVSIPGLMLLDKPPPLIVIGK